MNKERVLAKAVNARHIALKAEIKFMEKGDMESSIEFERVGKLLDRVIKWLQEDDTVSEEK